MNKNMLINGEFNIAQRGTSFDASTTPNNNDDTYLLDRWILLSDGNDVVDVSQVTDAPKGSGHAQKAVVQTASKKFGFVQIIENANCQQIVDAAASLSFQAQTGAGAVRNIRAAVLSWNGTADTVTSDVVSAWNAEGTNPTLATNWSYQNDPVNLSLSTSYQKFSIEDISINSDMKNCAVFIWVDDADAAVNDELYLGQIQLEEGSQVSDYEHRTLGMETSLAQRYFERQNYLNGSYVAVGQVGVSNGRVDVVFPYFEKRVAPNPLDITVSSNSHYQVFDATLTSAAQGTLASNTSTSFNGRLIFTRTGGATLVNGDASALQSTSDSAFVDIDAEL